MRSAIRTHLVPIGNSKGIRIPSSLLKLCNMSSNVDLEVSGNMLLIRPVQKKPRNGWSEAFKEMRLKKEDRLLIDDRMDLNIKSWKW